MSEMDVCNDEEAHFAQEPEGNELGGRSDLCGKSSALVTKGNDGRHSLLFR